MSLLVLLDFLGVLQPNLLRMHIIISQNVVQKLQKHSSLSRVEILCAYPVYILHWINWLIDWFHRLRWKSLKTSNLATKSASASSPILTSPMRCCAKSSIWLKQVHEHTVTVPGEDSWSVSIIFSPSMNVAFHVVLLVLLLMLLVVLIEIYNTVWW